MSPAHVIEPTYEAIRRRLMHGHWPPGTRLEAARIADQLHVSVTPVRDSLYRLTGERMVDFEHGEGFHVPRITESRLRAMLELHLVLVLTGLASRTRALAAAGGDPDGSDGFASLFRHIASRSGNAELAAVIAGLGDRLNPFRAFDASIFDDIDEEFEKLEAAVAKDAPREDIAPLLLHYHHRRVMKADAYVRLRSG